VTTEWAGTGRLIEFGGASVEGYIVPQYLDLQSTAPEFAVVRDTYRVRFQQDISFPAVVAYDAARVVFKALAEQKRGEALKQTLLRIRRFDGLQEPIVFDDFGDVDSATYLTEVRDGKYRPIQ
jgi:branched-chain amino acid transport system substrate-binding protein